MLPEPKASIPIIAVTAHAMAGAREEYLAAGMDGCITKPFSPATLLTTLAALFNHSEETFKVGAPEQREEEADSQQIDKLPVLDLERLNILGSVFAPSKIKSLASLYLFDVHARLVLVGEHRATNNFDGVSRQAHLIGNAAGNLGAKETSALAHALEASCASRDDERSDQLIFKLRVSCALSSNAIKRWLNTEAPGVSVRGPTKLAC
jgi:CheY-like chemotaxis protein